MIKDLETHFCINAIKLNEFDTMYKISSNMNGLTFHEALLDIMETNEKICFCIISAVDAYREKIKPGTRPDFRQTNEE